MKKLTTFSTLLIATGFTSLTLLSTPSFSVQSGYTNYVTDAIKTPLRQSPGYRYKIKRMLKPGSKVTILEVNDDGWANVSYRYKGRNITGWMPTVSLQNSPIARVKLKAQIEKTAKTEKKYNQLKSEISTLDDRYVESSTELKKIKAENFQLENELSDLKEISGKSIQINQQNKEFVSKIKSLESENTMMKERLSQAEDIVQRQWFLTGGGVLLLGLLLGRFFRPPSKKKRWDSL
jgi:SH3 domain protein